MLDRTDTIEHRSYIEKCADNEFKYKCEFLVGKFAPTDFKIKLKGSQLVVEAIHETPVEKKTPQQLNQENFYYDNDDTYTLAAEDTTSYLGKQTEKFVRELDMPAFVDLDSLSCYLETYEDFQNVLVVEGLVQRQYQVAGDADTYVGSTANIPASVTTTVAKNPQVLSSRNAKKDLRIESSSTLSSSKIYGSNQNVN